MPRPASPSRCEAIVTPGDRVVVPQTWAFMVRVGACPDARYFVDSRFELFPADVWHGLRRRSPPAAARSRRSAAIAETSELIVVPAGALSGRAGAAGSEVYSGRRRRPSSHAVTP